MSITLNEPAGVKNAHRNSRRDASLRSPRERNAGISSEGINYCPYCWKKITDRAEVCAACGGRLIEYHALSYEDKLLLALRHPLRENRAGAIHTLGRLKSEKALKEFEKQLIENDDILDLYEIMMALKNYDCDVKVPWFRTMIAHPSPRVSRLGRRLLIETESRECHASGATALLGEIAENNHAEKDNR
jgi:hypothetical protein